MKSSRSIVYALFVAVLISLIASISLIGTPTRAQDSSLTPSPTATSSDTGGDSATQAATDDASATDEVTSTPDNRVLIVVVSRIAVFRTGPGQVFPVVAQVYRGNKIQLSGISEDGAWFMFPYNKLPTWVSADPTITTLLEGDPHTLPVIPSPPTPTPRPPRPPRPTSAYASNADDGGFNAQYCDFDNTMTVEDQNAAVQAMYDAVDGNDWVLAGRRARRLYRKCPMKAQFYLLYVVYLPVSSKHPAAAPNEDEAFALFREGWLGMQ